MMLNSFLKELIFTSIVLVVFFIGHFWSYT
jgi:hypothetical protein